MCPREVSPARLDASHLQALMALEHRANDDAWSEVLLSAALSDTRIEVWGLWAAEVEKLHAAAVVAYLPFDAELQSLCVAPEQRRRGLARGLLEWIAQRALSHGAERLLLELRESNLAARGLYEGAGFEVDGERCGYYRREDGSSEAAVLMSRSLVSGGKGGDE